MTATDFTATRNLARGGILAALILIADQVTKIWMMETVLGFPRVIEITGFFNLVWVWNRGVSFGMFGGGGLSPWVFITFALAVCVGLAWWLRNADSKALVIGLSLLIGGAIGNVIDRIRFGAVFDFLDFHAAGYHWPAFNIADAAITIGVGFLLVDSLFRKPADNT